MLVETSLTALRTLRLRETCIEEKAQTSVIIRKRLMEVENGEACRLHGRGGKYLKATLLVPSCQGIVAKY